MPIFEVTDPSGRKFRVEGPPGSTADEALARVRDQSSAPAPSGPPPDSIQSTPVTPGAESQTIAIQRPFAPPPGAPGTGAGSVAPVVGRSTDGVPLQSDQGEFAKGVNAGVQQLQGTLYGLAGLVGDSIGNDALKDWGLEGYSRNQEQAEAVGPRIQSLSQIEDIGDFFDAAAGWMGSTSAFMATSLAGGGVGGVVGRSVAKAAVARLAAKGVAKEAAEAAVARAMADPVKRKLMASAVKNGALVGSGVTSALTQQGDLYGQLKQAGIEDAVAPAWGFGAIQGALDVIPEIMILKKLLPDQVGGELTKTLARGLAGTVAKQSVAEGITEGAQQSLSVIARITAGGADWADADTQSVLDSMAAGAVVGSIMGGGTEVAARVMKPGAGTAPKMGADQAVPSGGSSAAAALTAPNPTPPSAPKQTMSKEEMLSLLQTQRPAGDDNIIQFPGRPTAEPERAARQTLGMENMMDDDIVRRREEKEAANVLEHLDNTPEATLAQLRKTAAAAQAGTPTVMVNSYLDSLKKQGATPEQLMEARGLEGTIRQAKRARDEVAITTDPSAPAFDDVAVPTPDYTTLAPADTVDLEPSEKLGYLKWLNREATPEQRIAYEKAHTAEGIREMQIRRGERGTPDFAEEPHKSSVIGQGGAIEGELNEKAQRAQAKPWQAFARAEETALQLGMSDMEADYYARRVNAPEAQRLGLKQPGVYVFAQPKLGAELVNSKAAGGYRTKGQLARAFIARARSKWDSLPPALKMQQDTQGANKYGVPFIRTAADGKTETVYLDAREITKLGVTAEESLQTEGVNGAERLVRGFQNGLALIMDTAVNGVRYTPASQQGNGRLNLPGKLVLREGKQGSPITLGQARSAYMELSRNGGTIASSSTDDINAGIYESQALGGGEQRALIDEGVENDAADAIAASQGRNLSMQERAALRANERQQMREAGAPPVFERGRAQNPNPDNPGTGGDYLLAQQADSEAAQNARSTGRAIGNDAGTVDGNNSGIGATTGTEPAYDDGAQVSVTGGEADINAAMTSIVKGLKHILGIRGEIHVARSMNDYVNVLSARGWNTAAETAREHISHRDKLGQKINGFMQTLPDGSTAIFLPKGASQAQTIKTLAHEIGHTFFRQKYNGASDETKAALQEAYNKDKARFVNTRTDKNSLTEQQIFEEWMADQLAAWVASNKVPKTLIEKFLAGIVAGFQKIWDAITAKFPLDESFSKFVSEATTSPLLRDGGFDALGAQRALAADVGTVTKGLSDQVALLRQKNPTVDAVVDNTVGIARASANGFLSSVQARIRRMKIPQFDEIIKHFNLRPGQAGGFDFYGESDSRLQSFNHQYKKIVEGLTSNEERQLHQELMLERDLSTIKNERVRARAQAFRDLMQQLYRYQRNAHLPIRQVQDYFPMVGDKEQLALPEAPILIKDALGVNGITATDEQITNFIAAMMDDAYVADFDPAKIADVDANFRNPFVQAMRSRTLPKEWRDAIRGIKDQHGNARFYSKDMGEVMFRYINQAVRRAEYNKRLGDVDWDNEAKNPAIIPQEDGSMQRRPYDPHFKLRQLMNVAREKGASADDQAFIYEALSAMMGTHGRIKSEYMRKAANGMMAYQNLRTMSMVLFSSFPDLANNFVRTGNFKDTWKSMMGGLKESWKQTEERDSLLRAIGHAADTADHLSMMDVTNWKDAPGSTSNKINNAFFKAVGMHKWTNFTRALASRVAVDYINRHAQNGAKDSAQRLTELGLTAQDVGVWNNLRQPAFGTPGYSPEDMATGVTPEHLESVKKVTGAISRMVTETVVNARPPEKPMWGNAEAWKLVFHLKGFMYGFTNRILARTWYDISKDGSTTPEKAQAVAALAVTLPLAAMGLELKDWLQNGLWGRDSKLHEKDGWQYMTTVLNRSGALGMASMAMDAGEAGANGRAPLVALAGPTISQTNDLVQYGLYHAAAGAVPVLSSFPGARDGIKEILGTNDDE